MSETPRDTLSAEESARVRLSDEECGAVYDARQEGSDGALYAAAERIIAARVAAAEARERKDSDQRVEGVDRQHRALHRQKDRLLLAHEQKIASVLALLDHPHVIPVQTLEGVDVAPVIWPDQLRAVFTDIFPVPKDAKRAVDSGLPLLDGNAWVDDGGYGDDADHPPDVSRVTTSAPGGQCGDRSPEIGGAPSMHCVLPAEHTGWHKGDGGPECCWSPIVREPVDRSFYDDPDDLTDADREAKALGHCGPLRYGGPCWLMPGHQGPHHCYRDDIAAVESAAANRALTAHAQPRQPAPSVGRQRGSEGGCYQ